MPFLVKDCCARRSRKLSCAWHGKSLVDSIVHHHHYYRILQKVPQGHPSPARREYLLAVVYEVWASYLEKISWNNRSRSEEAAEFRALAQAIVAKYPQLHRVYQRTNRIPEWIVDRYLEDGPLALSSSS